MKNSLLVSLLTILSFASYSQSFDYSLAGKIGNADLLFEGRVVGKTSFFNADRSRIYTSNKVLVLKEFKGTFATDTVEVITQGGQVGDQFLEVSHTLKLSVGYEGVFFCKQTDCQNIKIDRIHSYRTVYDGMGFVRIYSDPFNPPALSEGQVYHDIQKEVYQPIVDITNTPMKILRTNHREEKKLQPRLRSDLRGDSINKDSLRSVIYYALQNLQLNATNATFDIYSFLPTTQKLFAGGSFVYRYDTTVLGSNIVSAGRMTATLASNLNSAAYTLTQADLSPNQALMKIAPTTALTSATSLSLAQTAVPVLNVQVATLQASTAFSDTTVSLDSVPMQQQSTYLDTATNALATFDTVKVTDNVKTLRSTDIAYTLQNFTIDNVGNTISFDIAATGAATEFSNGSIVLSYDTLAFGSFISTSVSATVGSLSSSDYIAGASDYAYNELEIDISNPNQANFNSIPVVVANVTLPFLPSMCSQLAGIAADNAATSGLVQNGNDQYFDPVNTVDVPYDNASASGSYDSALCPVVAPQNPTVTAVSDDCIGAGSFQVLTITGANFGTDTGTVYFRNADNGGLDFVTTQPQDILSWTDTEIQLLIPTSPGVAGSGSFYVSTPAGLNNAADTSTNFVNIAYANYNERNGTTSNPDFNKAEFGYLSNLQLTFQLAPNLFDSTAYHTYGAMQAMQADIDNINCQAGIGFGLDTTAASTATAPSATDGINLVVIMPVGAFSSPSVGMQTLRSGRYDLCQHNVSQYNDYAVSIFDIDIQINATLGGGVTWNWNDAVNVNSINFEDCASAFIHELGHGAGLMHSLPNTGTDVMFWTVQGRTLRDYNADPNDILGFQHMFDLGGTLASAGGANCDPVAVQTFGGGCTRLNPTTCTTSYPTLGIAQPSGAAFNAYLYPNPYQDNTVVHVDVTEEDQFSIRVYDMLGQLIFEKDIKSSTSFDVPLSNINNSAGIYLVEVSSTHTTAALKMSKL